MKELRLKLKYAYLSLILKKNPESKIKLIKYYKITRILSYSSIYIILIEWFLRVSKKLRGEANTLYATDQELWKSLLFDCRYINLLKSDILYLIFYFCCIELLQKLFLWYNLTWTFNLFIMSLLVTYRTFTIFTSCTVKLF